MGLAASQARFLNLTARKTNIEYEGQQINQQRTMLANQSANCYSQMLTLSVPVPPSESNFSTVVYTFTKNGHSCTINQVTGSDSNATILYTETYVNPYSMSQSQYQRDIANDNGTYSWNNIELVSLADFDNDVFPADAKDAVVTGLGYNQGEYANVYVLNKGTANTPSYEYFKIDQLNTIENGSHRNERGYLAGNSTVYEQGALVNTQITRNIATNRITALYNASQLSTTDSVAVTATTVKDDIAYDDAYAEYEYQTYLYQQKMEEINAQTSIIQAQDKKLELRLKQLDTEQNAVKTEMDSISSLIKDNTDKSFKVFA
ncbi:hypothetical protein IKE67_01610 [bacterium]|nr:hypothetical protein [bacterium]